ncbi:type II toxin-antitoxin system RelE/ParE family toxin [Methylomonas sp. 11b]|jgi:toxin ParE1/3/4|uniref:type II toxin-antitoxin system RelE/ParE family toxin n=1 Tax=Methylomonas sp. 11b TaxID=1168169 RepID=UPI00047CF23E|nr:type II toxin-antitoxin system RelE/ParE family toxin [Methylomonas sp. 11b]
MPRLLIRPEAESDLDEIWWYIAQDSPNQADKFLDRIQETLLALADYPKMGSCRDEIKNGVRSHSVGNYLIFYFPLHDGIDIIRVMNKARDIENLL